MKKLKESGQNFEIIQLPPPKLDGNLSVEAAIQRRRSVRAFSPDPLNLTDVSQLVWAAQGITHPAGRRAAPSAGALYPLEVDVVADKVQGLASGVYRYQPISHSLQCKYAGTLLLMVARAALHQDWITDAALTIAISYVFERTSGKYGDRASQYIHMEVGLAAENISLQVAAMDLGTVIVGAFQDREIKRLLRLSPEEHPLALLPVGRL